MHLTDLTGKTALITGGARGIGFESARLLAEHGAAVVIADINLDAVKKSADELKRAGHVAVPLYADVASDESITKMVKDAVAECGRLDILVNNAGILDIASVPELTLERWDRTINIDMRSVHLCSQNALPHMIKAGGGRIINIASMAGQIGGLASGPHYTAAKAGVIGMTKSYARYAAQYAVNVNCIAPGFMLTEMTRERNDDPSVIPLKKLGSALDVAKAVLFLATSMSDYITGATIDINGGLAMR